MSRASKGLVVRLDDWPEEHQVAWATACRNDDLRGKKGLAAKWRPASRRKALAGMGRFLGWLTETGRPLELPLAELVTPSSVHAFVEHLRDCEYAGNTIDCRLQELYDASRALAPGQDWGWLLQAYYAARQAAQPAGDKIGRLRSARELEELGRKLMAGAEDAALDLTDLQRAASFRDGLCICILIRRLLRLRNLAGLTTRHLVFEGETLWLVFPGSEMKSRQEHALPMSPELGAAIVRYLERYRPILLTVGGRRAGMQTDFLWISASGGILKDVPLHYCIRKRTEAAFGEPIPPHWFRDAGATAIAVDDPKHVRDVAVVLGNSDAIAEKHYNQARSIQGARRYQHLLANFREEVLE